MIRSIVIFTAFIFPVFAANADQNNPYPETKCNETVVCVKKVSDCKGGRSYFNVSKSVNCVTYEGKLVSYTADDLLPLDYSMYTSPGDDRLCNEEKARLLQVWEMCK